MSKWIYENGEVKTLVSTPPVDFKTRKEAFGFVYLVRHDSGLWYIGQKSFTKAGTRQVKGKKVKCRKPSDWEDYMTSSKTVQESIGITHQLRLETWEFRILDFAFAKSDLNYKELKWQLEYGVATCPQSMNGLINIRLNLKVLRQNPTTFEPIWLS